jgi:hypothetical protein
MALVFKKLERGIDDARTGPIEAAVAFFHQLDQFVAVAGLLCDQLQQHNANVAAAVALAAMLAKGTMPTEGTVLAERTALTEWTILSEGATAPKRTTAPTAHPGTTFEFEVEVHCLAS